MKKEDPRKQREALRRDEIRHSILRAAETVIMRKGYSAMTMDDVAGEARISKTTLYKYVTSKGRFVFKFLRYHMDEKEAGLRRIVEAGGSASEKLRLAVDDFLRSNREKHRLGQILMADEAVFKLIRLICKDDTANENEHIRKIIGVIKRKSLDIIGLIAEIVDKGIAEGGFRPVDSRETAIFIVSLLNGIQHNPFLRRETLHLTDEELSEKIFVFIHSSIRKPEDDFRKA